MPYFVQPKKHVRSIHAIPVSRFKFAHAMHQSISPKISFAVLTLLVFFTLSASLQLAVFNPGSPLLGQVSGALSRTTFLLKGESSELSGISSGATVTPAIGPSGRLIVRGNGSVNFAPARVGNGVYFQFGGQQQRDSAFYTFSGSSLGEIFNINQGEVTFYLKSSYSFAERMALPAGRDRSIFEVTDDRERLFSFRVTSYDGLRLFLNYRTARSGSEGNDHSYLIPSGQEDALFGKDVILKVRLVWNRGQNYLYLNDTLSSVQTYAPATPNWTANAAFMVGTQLGYGGGFFVSDDLIDEFTILSTSAPTPPPADTTAPTISDLAVSSITASAATIGWKTNEAADSQVEYGLTERFGLLTPLDSRLTTTHSVSLTSLAANTLYHYGVKSKDAAGNLAFSGDRTLTTRAPGILLAPPTIPLPTTPPPATPPPPPPPSPPPPPPHPLLPPISSSSAFLQTHKDKIPNFCLNPTIKSKASGEWSNSAIWDQNRVPAAHDIALIAAGTSVSYGIQSSQTFNCLGIDGILTFAPNTSTRLITANLMVFPIGQLVVGTPLEPIATDVNAEIIIADKLLDTTRDPSQYGTAFLAWGKVTMHGTPRSPTFVRLAQEPRAGDTTLTLSQTPTGWKSGDLLVLPDTRQLTLDRDYGGYVPSVTGTFTRRPLHNEWEELTIQAISGSTITVSKPLQYDHLGARDGSGKLEYLPHVGNISRNIIVRSENPQGVRGHALFTYRANVDIRYALFKDLGRTKVDFLNSTTFNTDGSVKSIGTNQIGRYPLHMHHYIGPITPQPNGYQFTLIGNAINNAAKWGLTVHGSHYGLVQDNVIYNAVGSGLVTEDGSETGNVFDHNFAIRSEGSGDAIDHDKREKGAIDNGHEGAGFWFRQSNNYIRNNVAANALTSGFTVYPFTVDKGLVRYPLFQGADTSVVGQYRQDTGANVFTADVNPLDFSGNESYSHGRAGFELWTIGRDQARPYTVRNAVAWHNHFGNFEPWYSGAILIDSLTARGDPKAIPSARLVEHMGQESAGLAVHGTAPHQFTIRNANIQGQKFGAQLSISSSFFSTSTLLIENSFFKNAKNIVINNNRNRGSLLATIRNAKYESLPGYELMTIERQWGIISDTNLTIFDRLLVYDHNQVGGDNFQIFALAQNSTAEALPTITSGSYKGKNYYGIVGCPETGLANQQCLAKYGVTNAGEITTCFNTRKDIVGGYTCLLSGSGSPPPPPPAPTPIPTSPPPAPSPAPTPTPPSPPPAPPSSPPSPSIKFFLNDRVHTTANLNVRSSPTTSGTLLGTQPSEALGTISGGPILSGGFSWWNVNYDNAPDGWSVEDFLVRALTSVPLPPPPPSTSTDALKLRFITPTDRATVPGSTVTFNYNISGTWPSAEQFPHAHFYVDEFRDGQWVLDVRRINVGSATSAAPAVGSFSDTFLPGTFRLRGFLAVYLPTHIPITPSEVLPVTFTVSSGILVLAPPTIPLPTTPPPTTPPLPTAPPPITPSSLSDRVLIIVNDRTPPESGTEGKDASIYVGEYYAKMRNIPSENIFHVHTTNSEFISRSDYLNQIYNPLRQFLDANNAAMKKKILYIVPVYGVPVSTNAADGFRIAVDSDLAALYSDISATRIINWYAGSSQFSWNRKKPKHFDQWADEREAKGFITPAIPGFSDSNWKMFLVTRLDGPSALIAKGLVDKAISAENGLTRNSGTGYFDWRYGKLTPSTDAYGAADDGVRKAAMLSEVAGFSTYLNDQGETGSVISPASSYAYVPQRKSVYIFSHGPNDLKVSLATPTVSNGELVIKINNKLLLSDVGYLDVKLETSDPQTHWKFSYPYPDRRGAYATLDKVNNGKIVTSVGVRVDNTSTAKAIHELRIVFGDATTSAFRDGVLLLEALDQSSTKIPVEKITLQFKSWEGWLEGLVVKDILKNEIVWSDNFQTDTTPTYTWQTMPLIGQKALWAWGWYTGAWDSYRFVTGAVGAQLTSYTAATIRAPNSGFPYDYYAGVGVQRWGWAFVPRMLEQGITGTWGAVAEPYINWYALGEILLDHLWHGYNFGESFYFSHPGLRWVMVAVGDPLYAPKIFQNLEEDTVAPSTPTNLKTTEIMSSHITLFWAPATDNREVTGYKIYRNGSFIGASHDTTYTDKKLQSATSYSYSVSAVDAAERESSLTPRLVVTTDAGLSPTLFPGSPTTGSITPSSATIVWKLKVSSNSQVEYGLTTTYTNLKKSSVVGVDHSVTLLGLKANATYHYQITSTSDKGITYSSPDSTFTTSP